MDVTAYQKLQAVSPIREWQGVTPVPMDELYKRISQGRLDMRVPVNLADGPDAMIPLSHLAALPVGQHMRIQVLGCKTQQATSDTWAMV